MTNLLPTFRFRRWRLVAVILFGLVLHAPTLNMGFFADDYSQQLVLQGLADHPTMRFWNLYDFGETPRPGDSTFESGAFPWWSSDDWKGRFFRPLTSMTLWLDHAMFGGWALGYPLTSLVWYAVLLVLVWKLYQSLGLSDDAALIALLILASMDSSLLPVGWPPNRNSLIETVFLVAAILVLRRFSPRAPWFTFGIALVLAICACLAKESGVAAFVLIAITLPMMHHASPESVDARWVWIGTVVWVTPQNFLPDLSTAPPPGVVTASLIIPERAAFVGLMMAKALAVTAIILVTFLTYMVYRRAIARGALRWGEIAPQAQYALVFIPAVAVYTMGFMGAIRELARQDWHVYGVLRDTTPYWYTTTLTHTSVMAGLVTLVFFTLMALLFWIGFKLGKAEQA